MSKLVSVDGGTTLQTGEDIEEEILEEHYQALRAAMDPDIRDQVAGRSRENDPEERRMFLRLYLERAQSDLVVG